MREGDLDLLLKAEEVAVEAEGVYEGKRERGKKKVGMLVTKRIERNWTASPTKTSNSTIRPTLAALSSLSSS